MMKNNEQMNVNEELNMEELDQAAGGVAVSPFMMQTPLSKATVSWMLISVLARIIK